MPINFHEENNRMTYTTRNADESWVSLIQNNVEVIGKQVVDIGCGGGIYTKAFANMGASHITGVDFSLEMIKGATQNCINYDNVEFVHGDAYDTKLHKTEYDIILERALIHHLDDLNKCFKEANRILKNNGILIVQDRTPKDCLMPGNESHLRGYFFEKYPNLVHKEIARRYDSLKVRNALEANGFRLFSESQIWEKRRIYNDVEAIRQDLQGRTGRSILHELTDNELKELVFYIESKMDESYFPIVEKDSWTVWVAIKIC
ncbi:class I SAM-dependent methyltransferase [Paenibacillus pabuli]|uniref:class I SAM-dependent methyltransferase n=1 Tax=Paenibacillus pabuli TaxID=1472 RepID=UPI001FFF2C7A|nr:class I SAM-dependent methyltransferase [Paenibacillus pabuli]UPK41261.1 methyltransferase domain-containing protein [Paenibacillus pabuli]